MAGAEKPENPDATKEFLTAEQAAREARGVAPKPQRGD